MHLNLKITSNHLADTLILSSGVSLVILIVAFGLMFIYTSGIPISIPLLLLLIAMSFIVGSAYFDKKGAHSIYSLIGGAIVSASATFIITTLIGGIIYIFTASKPPLESIVSVIALLMITSLVVLRVISYQVRTST